MIDNVSAYTIYENDEVTFDEEFIYNSFKSLNSDFNIENSSKIYCISYSSSHNYIFCYAFDTSYEDFNNFSWNILNASDSRYITSLQIKYDSFQYNKSNNSIVSTITSNPVISLFGTYYSVSSGYNIYTNYDYLNDNDTLSMESKNVLDFSEYTVDLKFNENLFKDNPDFKEVCVDSSKHFAITSTIMSDVNSVYDFDYIWFPYNLNGIHKILYDNSVETSEIHYEEIIERYFFNTKENIDLYFDNDIPGLELVIKGYTDKYSYYGWSAFPFRVYYSESVNQFNIFWFDSPTKIYIGNLGEDGSVHGGGGSRLDFDNEIDNDNNYCFYIKNMYEVTEVNLNEFNDYYGSVPTPNGTLDFTTSFNESNMDSGGLMTQVNKFIIHMKDTFEFIKDFVYEFYLSMPLLFRMFLISVLVILMVGFIIRMVVK